MLTEIGLGMRCDANVLRMVPGELSATAARVLVAAGLEETICRLRLTADGRLVPVTDEELSGVMLGKRKKDVEDEEESAEEEEEEDDDLEDDDDEDFEDDEEEEDEFEEEFEDDELDDDDDDIFYDDDDDD